MKTLCLDLAAGAMMLIGCAAPNKPDPACCDNPTTQAATCSPVETKGAAQPVAVVDSLAPIKAAFNARADKPRVVLLVSPVCSECVLGAQAVRKSIMDRFASSGVHAIVVWVPMLEPDNETAATKASAIFAGADAVQFYDPQRLAGWAYQNEQFSRKWDELEEVLPADHWLRKHHSSKPAPGPEWDIYMLYGPGVRWEDRTPKPDAFIRHIGRDQNGKSHYFRDRFNAPPTSGDLHEAMEAMGRDVLADQRAMKIELLGFPGCPNTPQMRENLRAALKSMDTALRFEDVDQQTLAESDERRGWPTPTVLVNGQDLFGMPAPAGRSPGCRMYAGGVPDSATIGEQIRALRSRQTHARKSN